MGVSLQSLSAVQASDTPFEFEYFNEAGKKTGVFFTVLGAESEQVKTVTNAMLNDRRREEAQRDIRKATGGKKTAAEFTPIEDDIDFGRRITATKLIGWRGIDEDFTPELGLALVQSNRHIADAIAAASDDLTNFMKASPKS